MAEGITNGYSTTSTVLHSRDFLRARRIGPDFREHSPAAGGGTPSSRCRRIKLSLPMSRHLTPIIASLVAHSGLLWPMLIDPLFSVIASDIDIRIEGNEFIPGALTTGECVKLKHSGRVVQILDLCYRPYTWCELSFLFVREFVP